MILQVLIYVSTFEEVIVEEVEIVENFDDVLTMVVKDVKERGLFLECNIDKSFGKYVISNHHNGQIGYYEVLTF